MSDQNNPEKMDLKSLDVAQEKKASLKTLFPTVFTETKNEQGELVESIDFEKLKAELGTFSDVFEARRERYGMDWPGKKDAMKLVQEPSIGTLKPCREESINFDTTENFFIEGDNLEILKLLQKSYYGKVKMIYIDPPYNTGNEFIYPDKYAETLDTYLAYAGLADDEGKKFSTNTPNEGRYHTKWLNMMYPRLYLALNLLREDGVIAISIDDHEVDNLRKVCNEIFGEDNFIAQLVWEKGRKNDARLFSVGHEYILIFAKSLSYLREKKTIWREQKPGAQEIFDEYIKLRQNIGKDDGRIEKALQVWFQSLPKTHPSKKLSRYRRVDVNGPWRDRDISWPGGDGPRYDVIHPITKIKCKVPEGGWRFSSPEEMNRQIKLGLVEFRADHTEPPFCKAHIKPIFDEQILTNVNDDEDQENENEEIATNVRGSYFYKQSQVAVKYLKKLMNRKLFDNPKDHIEILRLIRYVIGNDKNAIVLDFFAGSGTTAEAILQLNLKDKTNRRFIIVQLPEPCDPRERTGKAAIDLGLFNIAEICKERIRRVIKKLVQEKRGKECKDQLPGFEGGSYNLDLGFKVLKLDKSNFKIWNGANPEKPETELNKQLELHIDHIESSATQEDILFELLLKAGFMPTENIKKRELAGKTVFSISEGALLICLEDEITRELIDVIAEAEPHQFICLDRGFQGNDQLKANTVQTFSARNQGREKAEQIVFRTV